jgi:hypothetical protein
MSGSTELAPGNSVSEHVAVDADEANNPFQADGELRRKADFIITHSRISRTELQITDPDVLAVPSSTSPGPVVVSSQPAPSPGEIAVASETRAAATDGERDGVDGAGSVAVQSNGVETAIVTKTDLLQAASSGSPSRAEKVTLKKKKPCVVQ